MDDALVYVICTAICVMTTYGKGIACASIIAGHFAFCTIRFYKAHRTESMLVLGKVVWCRSNIILRFIISTSILASKWLSLLFLLRASPLSHVHMGIPGISLLLWAVFAPRIQSRLHRSWLHMLEATNMEEERGMMIT